MGSRRPDPLYQICSTRLALPDPLYQICSIKSALSYWPRPEVDQMQDGEGPAQGEQATAVTPVVRPRAMHMMNPLKVHTLPSGFRVQGSGFRVQGSGFRVQGSGLRVQGSGFRVPGSGFRVQGSGFRVQG